MKRIQPREMAAPPPTSTRIRVVKYSLAFSPSPVPMTRATSALPPVPIIKPKAPTIMVRGKMMFTAARALSPTRLDTNSPSTTE